MKKIYLLVMILCTYTLAFAQEDTLSTQDFTSFENDTITQIDFAADTQDIANYKNEMSSIFAERDFNLPWQTKNFIPFDTKVHNTDFILNYNRVESIFLGFSKSKKYDWKGEEPLVLYGFLGYGLKSHKVRTSFTLAKHINLSYEENSKSILELGIEGYNLTDTKDKWSISTIENALSSFIIHEDFRNYFERKGASIFTAHYYNSSSFKSEIKVAYISDKYKSLSNVVDWALFGGDKKFRKNPAINDGKMNSVAISGGFTTIKKSRKNTNGWSVYAYTEFAKKSYGGIFDFDQYLVDVRRFQPIHKYMNINIRLRGASSVGNLPLQKNYSLGGFGTLPAYHLKQFAGNRMILINSEFVLNEKFVQKLVPSFLLFLSSANLYLLSDWGYVSNVNSKASFTSGFESLKMNTLYHSLGLAVGSDNIRIGLAWRTDIAAPISLIFRISQPF